LEITFLQDTQQAKKEKKSINLMMSISTIISMVIMIMRKNTKIISTSTAIQIMKSAKKSINTSMSIMNTIIMTTIIMITIIMIMKMKRLKVLIILKSLMLRRVHVVIIIII
jgi:hypothetical protein